MLLYCKYDVLQTDERILMLFYAIILLEHKYDGQQTYEIISTHVVQLNNALLITYRIA